MILREKIICTIIAVIIAIGATSWIYYKNNRLAISGKEMRGKIIEASYEEIEESNPEDGYYQYSGFHITYLFSIDGAPYTNSTFINKKALGILATTLDTYEDFEKAGVDLLIDRTVDIKYLPNDPAVNALAFQSKWTTTLWDISIYGGLLFIVAGFVRGILMVIFKID